MGSDYATIRAQSRKKYGSDISNYGPTLLANLYSTRTHFLFELLQNAEDANATRIVFRLTPKHLEVRHNGTPFTPTDVHSICSIARTSKREKLNSIGKFGIGFKAVYAYTNSPTLHPGDEHFRAWPNSTRRPMENPRYTRPFVRPFCSNPEAKVRPLPPSPGVVRARPQWRFIFAIKRSPGA